MEVPASRSIKSLSAILTALDNRLNFVSWALLNGLFIWDILHMVRLESWQKKHSNDVQQWFEVTGEIDVLNCFASFRFNRPDTIFPLITEGSFQVDAKEAGHPLIDPEKRVDNAIRIREGEFILITGANMAGKSTYLRTIGVNFVLAMAGAPVCADSFSFTPTRIFTSIRTADSLQENESYFYAELKRLKSIIDALKEGDKLFIILDEILKGTNSTDKHAGSEALLKQFLSFKTTGIVATHDVSLGVLQEKYPDNIRNHCFEVDIQGNQLFFDYKLRNGISKNMNATILMREMGITI
jgi:DNA mismatch repair ATPase MutS